MTAELAKAEFGLPGPLRDHLVELVLDGTKTTSSALLRAYEVEGRDVPVAGARQVLVDSQDREVGVLEVTEVRVVPLVEVDLAHVLDEGEGYLSVPQWRASHERFWRSPELRAELGDGFELSDQTQVVLTRFRVVEG